MNFVSARNAAAACALMFCLFACVKNPVTPPEAKKGVLDLSQYNLNERSIALRGEWEFHWKRLSPPAAEKSGFMKVPGPWTGKILHGKKLPATGYAVYRLRVLLPANQDGALAFRTQYMGTAFALEVDGRVVAANGRVGKSAGESKPLMLPGVFEFLPRGKSITIALRISNFHHARGGPWSNIQLGTAREMRNAAERSLNFELFLFGSLLFMGLYHLGVFLLRRDDKSAVLFAVFCLLIALRTLFTGERYLPRVLSFMSFTTALRLEYFTFYVGTVVFTSFIHSVFERDSWKFVPWSAAAVCAVFLAVMAATPPLFFSGTVKFFQIFTVLCGIYIITVLTRAAMRGRDGVYFIIAGFFLMFLTVVNDILYANQVIQTGYFAGFGLFMFLFLQSFLLSRRLSGAFDTAEKLTEELEGRVRRRGRDLRESRERLRKLNEFNHSINQATRFADVMPRIFEFLREEFGIDAAVLQLLDREKNEFYTYMTSTPKPPYTDAGMREFAENLRIPLDESSGLIYAVYNRRKSLFISDIEGRADLLKSEIMISLIKNLRLKSVMLIPMLIENEVTALLFCTSYKTEFQPDRETRGRLDQFCAQFAGAIRRFSLLKQVREERAKSERLLLSILPEGAARELKANGRVVPEQFPTATVIVADFKGFTRAAKHLDPGRLVRELDGIFVQFETICANHEVTKLKTLGDAFIGVAGIPAGRPAHAVDVCLAALEILEFMKSVAAIKRELSGGDFWELRIGIHSGPATAGVIGKSKFSYDVWGNAPTVAAKIEASGAAGFINISQHTRYWVDRFFETEDNGVIDHDGFDPIPMYFLKRIRPELSYDEEGYWPNSKFMDMLAAYRAELTPGTTPR